MNTSTCLPGPGTYQLREMCPASLHLASAGYQPAKPTGPARSGERSGRVAPLPNFRLNEELGVFIYLGAPNCAACLVGPPHAQAADKLLQPHHSIGMAKKEAQRSETPDPKDDDSEAAERNPPEDEMSNRVAAVINPPFPFDSATAAADDSEQGVATA